MPSVPRYNQPQVTPSALPNVRRQANVPEEFFGAGPSFDKLIDTARDVGKIGAEIYSGEEKKKQLQFDAQAKLIAAEKKRADSIKVQGSDLGSAELVNRLKIGLSDYVGERIVKFLNDTTFEAQIRSGKLFEFAKNNLC